MKIGILCTMINGFGRKGFYNTQEIGLGRALARKNHRVIIYKCLNKKDGTKKERVEIQPGLTLYYLPIGGLGAHGYLKTDVLSKDLDGLLCFSDNQVFLPHIYRFCRKNEICFVPYVGTVSSLHGGLHGKVMDAWFHRGTLGIFKKTAVIAKTHSAKQKLKALGVRDVTVAPVGLDEAVLKKDFRSWDPVSLRREYGLSAEDVVLCSICRLEPEKRPMDLIKILAQIKDKKNFKLLLVGEGPLRQDVEHEIAKYGLEENVKLIKRIPYENIWKIFVMSDYFINLSKGEIFGMAIMEAVYYETSVAAIQAPGPSVTLKDMEGHGLCRDDHEIQEWLTGEYPSEKVLEQSSQKMLRDFSWDRCADTLIRIVTKEAEIK